MNKSLFFVFSFLILLLLFPTNINPEEKKTKTETSKKEKKLFQKEEKEKVNLEDLEKLGIYEPIKKYPEGMTKLFTHCKDYNLYCASKVAGMFVYKTFAKRSAIYGQRHPEEMMKAMAMYEVLYHSKLKDKKEKFERYRKNWPSEYGRKKKRDEEAIRSLKSMNEGREKMRGALGMTLDTSIEDAMNRFWILGEFLEMGEPKKLGKLDKDVKKRRELLKKYKSTVTRLKEKLNEEE